MAALIPPSPSTPARKRKSLRLSGIIDMSMDSQPRSSYTSGTTNGTLSSRRSSRTSQTSYQPQSPVTPRPHSSRSSRHSFQLHRRKSSRASINSLNSVNSLDFRDTSGLGNLADELEGAWDHNETQGSSFLEGLREGDHFEEQDTSAIITEIQSPVRNTNNNNEMNDMYDFGFATNIPSPIIPHDIANPNYTHSPYTTITNSQYSPQKLKLNHQHKRTDSAYDGSDYGPESDVEDQVESFPPILRKRLRDIEKLARMSHDGDIDDSFSEGGGVVKRSIKALKDLGPQSNIEYGVTRMVTAYTSMATHRTHKQRDLFSQSHSLLYGGNNSMGLMFDLPEEAIDLLLSDLTDLSSTTPFIPAQNPLLSLQILAAQTTELTTTLRSLTDLLQESRVAANAATRKLKSVRDMVEDLRVEEDLVEQSILLIQAGDWDRRCRQRQAAQTCREVVEGFADRWGLDRPEPIGVAM